MPHARNRNPSPIPEVTWDTGLKEMNETWKGAIACFGVAVFFAMTIGIIYWQVVDQPNKNWILRGTFSGLIWERNTHSIVIQTLTENKTFVEIGVKNVGNPEADVPFVRNLCWSNKTEFCFTWDSVANIKISLESDDASQTECYNITWTPLNCHMDLEDCFSMINVSWYGGASVQAQNWPINNASVSMQPFVVSDLQADPLGYGSVLERYFLGSTGVAVLVDPEVALQVGFESMRRFCLRKPPSMAKLPLKYTVCVGSNLKAMHQEVRLRPLSHKPALPNMDILWLPFWKLLVNVDSGVKLERELRTFSNRLKRLHLGEGVLSLTEHSTALLSDMLDHEYLYGKKKVSEGTTRDLTLLRLLNISATLSPFLGIDSQQFQASLEDGREAYWLSLPATPQGHLAPLLTHWKEKFCVKLNVSNPAAVAWFIERVSSLRALLGVEYLVLEGGERNPFQEHGLCPPKALARDEYIQLLAEVATRISNSVIVTAGTRPSQTPLFLSMVPLSSDWSHSGLKGLIPSVLHYSLLGHSFFIPDAVAPSPWSLSLTRSSSSAGWRSSAFSLSCPSRLPPGCTLRTGS
ncbi:SITS-binding protein-like isoform X2 [Conger conger]|uniref:SITS-binding protein-like isoform X2 n=1 Tax=Conger conger TaxID=82655 RepID=UPI002A5989BC|nr:SITS-binding protein-like isoform X2 [Conger conger]